MNKIIDFKRQVLVYNIDFDTQKLHTYLRFNTDRSVKPPNLF